MSEVVVAGETLVDFVPRTRDALADVESFDRRAGGAPANVAVALSRLGHRPAFFTRVGGDAFGDHLADVLEGEGVGEFVQRDPDRATALAFVGRDPDDPRFSFYREDTADCHLDTSRVPDSLLERASWLVVGGVMLAARPGRDAIRDLVSRARAADCGVVFDPNGRPELWESAEERRDVTRSLLADADVVVAGRDDLPWLTADAFAESVLDSGPSAVAVTRGAAGAALHAREGSPWGASDVSHPGFSVEAVDDTGAGDAFTAGLVASLADGRSAEETVAFANACGAAAVTGTGAMTALPSNADVERYL